MPKKLAVKGATIHHHQINRPLHCSEESFRGILHHIQEEHNGVCICSDLTLNMAGANELFILYLRKKNLLEVWIGDIVLSTPIPTKSLPEFLHRVEATLKFYYASKGG